MASSFQFRLEDETTQKEPYFFKDLRARRDVFRPQREGAVWCSGCGNGWANLLSLSLPTVRAVLVAVLSFMCRRRGWG